MLPKLGKEQLNPLKFRIVHFPGISKEKLGYLCQEAKADPKDPFSKGIRRSLYKHKKDSDEFEHKFILSREKTTEIINRLVNGG
jgi:hypothetical protein